MPSVGENLGLAPSEKDLEGVWPGSMFKHPLLAVYGVSLGILMGRRAAAAVELFCWSSRILFFKKEQADKLIPTRATKTSTRGLPPIPNPKVLGFLP